MYVPDHFSVRDSHTLADFIAANSFATFISSLEGAPFATHLPLILDRDDSPHGTLLGHMAAANPHWRCFDGVHDALAIFHGPHAYISPSWYKTSPAVPTWNYAVVHVYGRPALIRDEGWLSSFVDSLTAHYDPQFAATTAVPDEFKRKLLKSIVGFRMEIDRVEGKFKLSQNRPDGDRLRVVEHLEAGADPTGRALAELTRQQLHMDVEA